MFDAVGEIKKRINIIELVGEYVPLKKAGGNWRGLCPFHKEKTPSFMVSEDKQIWHCFGCGEGGDVFEFVKKMEGMEFAEALRMLAQKAQVTLERFSPAATTRKTRLLDLCSAAADFFHRQLLQAPQADHARAYVQKRGLRAETVEDFQLGYASAEWEILRRFLLSKRFSDAEIFEAGLTVKSERRGSFYDRFRDRLMFPIHDISGNVVGFGGRALNEQVDVAKYMNSPETPLYHKGRLLFNLHRAKQKIRQEGSVLIVEGYMDVITPYQYGFQNIVATSGTALTLDHVRLLARYTKKLLFAFDADAAGQQAAVRAVLPSLEEDADVYVLELKNGKDPDESVRNDAAAFSETLQNARPFMDVYIDRQQQKFSLADAVGKKAFAREVLGLIAKLPDPVVQSHYIHVLAERLNVDGAVLSSLLPRFKKSQTFKSRYEQPTAQAPQKSSSRQTLLFEKLFTLLLLLPSRFPSVLQRVDPEIIEDSFLRELYKKFIIYYTQFQEIIQKTSLVDFLLADFSTEKRFASLVFAAEEIKIQRDVKDIEQEIDSILFAFMKDTLLGKIRLLQEDLRQAEREGDSFQVQKLSEEFTQYTEQLHALTQKL